MTELKKHLLNYIDENAITLDADMGKYTSFRCGGPAAMLVQPDSLAQLLAVLDVLRDEKSKFMVMGNGSNILFTEKGYDGVVVKVGKGMDRITCSGNTIYAESGILLSALSKYALDQKLSGLEFACGIPGSLGGAVFMNAGAYGGEMKNVVSMVSSINSYGIMKDRPADKLDLSYRHSIFMENGEIILGVRLKLDEGLPGLIEAKMKENNQQRNSRQPVHLGSAGSFFKRPEGYFAGKLIEDAGLKGLTVGGAQVSKMHAGFIVNLGSAVPSDIINLMAVVQETVLDKFGVKLEPEVRII